ncbi:hypothetical protein [Amycolatopsis carbonis]|uniref:hypothetical protein n=1 Tax=Amycolatopsis carbonis TaxID=715471 RepID=UPI003DA7545C
MSFFTDGPRERPLFPVREQELFGYEGRPWMGPPNDHIVPTLLPWARPLGRSERTIVALRGIEVWPSALTLRLAVYSRDSLQEGRSGSLIDHRRIPDYNALLVGVLYPDGRRASSESLSVPSASEPAQPILRAVGGGGTQFHLDHQIFVWPLPGNGPFTLVVQWLDRDIEETHTELDGAAIRAAAVEAGELWPGLPKRPGNGVALRHVRVAGSGVASTSTSTASAASGASATSGADGALPVRSPESAGPLPRRDAADSAAPGEPFPHRTALGAAEDRAAEPPRNPGGAAPLPGPNAASTTENSDSQNTTQPVTPPGEAFPHRTALGAAEDHAAEPPRNPGGAAPLPGPNATGTTENNSSDNAAQPVTAPGELQPERSPSVLLPRLAGGASLLPRRNVALGPERPMPRPPGTAGPLPRRTPTSRSGNAPLAQPPAGLAGLAAEPVPPESPAEPVESPQNNTDSPTVALPVSGAADAVQRSSEPAPRPERNVDTGDSPTVALPTPAAAGPSSQTSEPPRSPAPLPQPSRPLPQPSRSVKDVPQKPGRGGRAWRWRDPGE